MKTFLQRNMCLINEEEVDSNNKSPLPPVCPTKEQLVDKLRRAS
jgi:hypothetical protein